MTERYMLKIDGQVAELEARPNFQYRPGRPKEHAVLLTKDGKELAIIPLHRIVVNADYVEFKGEGGVTKSGCWARTMINVLDFNRKPLSWFASHRYEPTCLLTDDTVRLHKIFIYKEAR